ncbi:hypothetical protein MTO96_044068 [Rhipicephalus appendiculatus]
MLLAVVNLWVEFEHSHTAANFVVRSRCPIAGADHVAEWTTSLQDFANATAEMVTYFQNLIAELLFVDYLGAKHRYPLGAERYGQDFVTLYDPSMTVVLVVHQTLPVSQDLAGLGINFAQFRDLTGVVKIAVTLSGHSTVAVQTARETESLSQVIAAVESLAEIHYSLVGVATDVNYLTPLNCGSMMDVQVTRSFPRLFDPALLADGLRTAFLRFGEVWMVY